MADILAAKTSLPRWQRQRTFETFRAEALFASTLQPSGSPSCEQVRRVVATTLRRLGPGERGAHGRRVRRPPGHRGSQDVLGAGDGPRGLPAAVAGPAHRTGGHSFRELTVTSRVELRRPPDQKDREPERPPR